MFDWGLRYDCKAFETNARLVGSDIVFETNARLGRGGCNVIVRSLDGR